MGFTNEQLRAIDAQGKVIVSASAGSGKTTVMIEKIIRLITSGVGVDEILAVTFTKKAASQMKEKLSRALIEAINAPETDGAKRAVLKRQLSGVPNADISTIHSYCSKLIRSHFFAAEVDSGFRVIGGEDAEGRALKNAALDELLEEGYESGDEDFSHLLSSYWRKKKDTALRKIFITTYNSLRDRADYRAFLEKNTQGYTKETFDGICAELFQLFQEKCKYYYELVEDENAYFTSVESISKNQLQLCKELMDWLTEYGLATDFFAAKSIGKPKFTVNRGSNKDTAEKKEHTARLSFLKDRIVDAYEKEFLGFATYEEELSRLITSGKTAAALAKYILRFDEKYAALKTERGVLDYNDLEHKALALLNDEEIAAETQKKYRYVFVDEYQDVNPVQEAIVSKLATDNLFLVGDVKQSIYGFRGSKSTFFVEKQREFENGYGQNLFMKYNFRSADKVLDAINAQFALAMTPRVCDVDYARDSVMEKGGRYALNSGKVEIHFTPKEGKSSLGPREVYSVLRESQYKNEDFPSSAYAMASVIEKELCGYLDDGKEGKRRVRYGDIAVLTRKTAGEIESQIAALTEFGFPVTASSAVNVCEFTEVKALIDILSLLDNAEQDIPLCSALLSGMGKLSAEDLANVRLAYQGQTFRAACQRYSCEKSDEIAGKLKSFYAYFEQIRVESCVLSVGEVLSKILADTQMEAGLLTRKSGAVCLKRIRRFLEEATSFGGVSVHDFLEHLRNLEYKIDYNENGGEDSIKVMTMHSSKGLEFPIVLLANLSQPFRVVDSPDVCVEEKYGLAPRAFNPQKMLRYNTLLRRLYEVKESKNSLSDELNLYYVALTRAERTLHLFFKEKTVMPDVKYAKSFAEFTDFSVWEEYIVEDAPFEKIQKQVRQTLLTESEDEQVAKIIRAFGWEYAHTGYENLPVKSSPTGLMDGKYVPQSSFKDFGKTMETDEMETEQARALAVREGTAYHAFLENFDFSLLVGENGNPINLTDLQGIVEEKLSVFADSGIDVSLLSAEKLVEILSNSVFYELLDMRLYKEQQFLVSLPVSQTFAKKEGYSALLDGKEEMLFQGAIDLLAVGEGVRVIDYKYSSRGADELKAHYQPQLDLYRLAVAKIMKIDEKSIRCTIVNIKRGFQVDVD